VVDARITIEPVIARLVAERQDPDVIAALEAFLASHADAATTASPNYQVEDASGFHSLLAGMTGNPVLTLTARSLQEVLLDRARGLFPAAEQEQIERAHAGIARAIIKGEGAKAERLMRQHMQHQYIDVAKARHPAVYDETVDWK